MKPDLNPKATSSNIHHTAVAAKDDFPVENRRSVIGWLVKRRDSEFRHGVFHDTWSAVVANVIT
jgi:hypothetical protein